MAYVDQKLDVDMYPLSLACARGSLAIFRDLLHMGADPNQAITRRFGYGLEVQTPIEFVCERIARRDSETGYWLDLLAYLITRGAVADFEVENVRPITPLHPLCISPSAEGVEAMRLLLENGADPDIPYIAGATPLQRLCQDFDVSRIVALREAVVTLLKFKAKVNIVDDTGSTPLHSLCKRLRVSDSLALI